MYKTIIITLFLLSSSATFVSAQNSNEVLLAGENKERALRYYLVNAKKYLAIGNIKKAIENYKQCLTLVPEDPTIHYELADIAMALNKTEAALKYARIATKKSPKNKWFLQQLIAVMKARGLWGQVDEIYDKLIAVEPRKQYYLEKLAVYKRLEDWEQVLQTYTDIQKQFQNDFKTIIGKQAIYSKLNRQKDAIEELKSIIKKNPNNGDFQAVLALRYEEDNNTEDAKKAYEKLANFKDKGRVGIIILANYYIKTKAFNKAFLLLKQALTDDISEPQMVIGSVKEFSKKNKTKQGTIQADILSSMLVKNYPESIVGYLIQAKHLRRKKQYIEAERMLKDALEVDSLNYTAMSQLVAIYEKQHDLNSLLNISKKGILAFPKKHMFYIYKGVAEMDLKNYDDAEEDFKIGIFYAPTVKDKNIVKSLLAECYFLKSEKDKAFEIYEDQLQTDPRNVDILNNYSYQLAVAGEKLDKATEMIKKCLEAAPLDAYFLDTYAVILYKQGKYKNALTQMEKLVKNNTPSGISSESYNNYGNILWKNGKKDKAREIWKKALEKSTIQKKANIEDKIKNGLKE